MNYESIGSSHFLINFPFRIAHSHTVHYSYTTVQSCRVVRLSRIVSSRKFLGRQRRAPVACAPTIACQYSTKQYSAAVKRAATFWFASDTCSARPPDSVLAASQWIHLREHLFTETTSTVQYDTIQCGRLMDEEKRKRRNSRNREREEKRKEEEKREKARAIRFEWSGV